MTSSSSLPKRIVIVCNSASATFHFRADYIRSLKALGKIVSCVSFRDHGRGEDLRALCNGTSVVFESPLHFASWRLSLLVMRRSDAIHAFTHSANLFALVFARGRQSVVCTITGLGRLWSMSGKAAWLGRCALVIFYAAFLIRAKALIFQNKDDEEFFRNGVLSVRWLRRLAIFRTPGSGIDVEACKEYGSRKSVSDRIRLRIGFFSRADALKGIGIFYSIASRLGLQHEFIHAGHPGTDRFARQQISETARGSNVKYLGVLKNPLPAIADCDLVLLPTTYREGVPRLLLECFALGVPAVCFPSAGIVDHVDHGINSFIARDEREMEETILRLTSDDLARVSSAQRTYAARNLSVETVTAIYFDALRER